MPNWVHTVAAIIVIGAMSWAIYTNELYSQLIVAGIVTVYIGIVAWASANIRSGFFVKSISRLPKGKLAITFDDGPTDLTPEFLDFLKTKNIPATFFLIGRNIEGKEEIVQRIKEEGHTIGNHSYQHDYMFASRGKRKVLADINRCSDVIETVVGEKPKLFRPPFGVTTPNLASALKKANLKSVGWSVRTHDGVRRTSEQIERNLFSKELSGAIVLFHDTNFNTLEVLEKLIRKTEELGIEIVSLEEEIEKFD